MRTRVSLALNKVELHSLDPAIVIRGIREGAPARRIDTASKGEGVGLFVNRIERQSREVAVTFAINKRDAGERMRILQDVIAWAVNGGMLETDYRNGQLLRVECSQLPDIGDVAGWTDEYTVGFTAYRIPYWENTERTAATIAAGTSGNNIIRLTSTAISKLCVEAVNASGGTLAGLSVLANGARIELTGANIAAGETVQMFYDQNDIQVIRAESAGTARSLLAYRTPESADYIPLGFGENVIFVTSTGAVSWTLYTYGRWE